MLVEGTIPPQSISLDTNTDKPEEAIRQFIARYPGARVEKLDGEFVRGLCACCCSPISASTSEHDYQYDPETDSYVCRACLASEAKTTRGKR